MKKLRILTLVGLASLGLLLPVFANSAYSQENNLKKRYPPCAVMNEEYHIHNSITKFNVYSGSSFSDEQISEMVKFIPKDSCLENKSRKAVYYSLSNSQDFLDSADKYSKLNDNDKKSNLRKMFFLCLQGLNKEKRGKVNAARTAYQKAIIAGNSSNYGVRGSESHFFSPYVFLANSYLNENDDKEKNRGIEILVGGFEEQIKNPKSHTSALTGWCNQIANEYYHLGQTDSSFYWIEIGNKLKTGFHPELED